MSIIGSTAKADLSPRIFRIDIPAIDCFFSGTGDMFAGLTVVRLREAVLEMELGGKKSWISPDNIQATDLPLAKAAEKVLGSMHAVLVYTKQARDQELGRLGGPLGAMEKEKDSEKRLRLRRTKAAEVRVVRCLGYLKESNIEWKAVPVGANMEGQDKNMVSRKKEAPPNENTDLTPNESKNERDGLGMQYLAGQTVPADRKEGSQ